MATESAKPHLAGIAYGQQAKEATEANALLEEFLDDPIQPIREFVHGLVAALHERFGPTWSKELLDTARKDKWNNSRVLEVLLALPCGSETWQLVESLGEEIRSEYWQKTRVLWFRENEEQTVYCIRRLLGVRRGRTAVGESRRWARLT